MWLHGGCAGITNGICGNFNGNPSDDLIGNDPNVHGEKYMEYDDNCPAPPLPYHACDALGLDAKAKAEAICNTMKSNAELFSSSY